MSSAGQNLATMMTSASDGHLLQQIRDYFKAKNALALLDQLPPVEALFFKPQTFTTDAIALKLMIGYSKDAQLWAYVYQFGDKPREVRYSAEPPRQDNDPAAASEAKMELPDSVGKYTLLNPFAKIYGDGQLTEKRALAIVIKYYFALSGNIADGVGGNLGQDFCYRLFLALEKMGGEAAGLPLSDRPKRGRPFKPAPVVIPGMQKLRDYLKSKNCEHLMRQIPQVDEMLFKEQSVFANGVPAKLFMGTSVYDQTVEIWAYMRRFGGNNYHEIRFYKEANSGRDEPVWVQPKEVIEECTLVEPFTDLCPECNQKERAKISLMVKYYFMAAGHSGDLFSETEAFGYRFKIGVEYLVGKAGSRKWKKGVKGVHTKARRLHGSGRGLTEDNSTDEDNSVLRSSPPFTRARGTTSVSFTDDQEDMDDDSQTLDAQIQEEISMEDTWVDEDLQQKKVASDSVEAVTDGRPTRSVGRVTGRLSALTAPRDEPTDYAAFTENVAVPQAFARLSSSLQAPAYRTPLGHRAPGFRAHTGPTPTFITSAHHLPRALLMSANSNSNGSPAAETNPSVKRRKLESAPNEEVTGYDSTQGMEITQPQSAYAGETTFSGPTALDSIIDQATGETSRTSRLSTAVGSDSEDEFVPTQQVLRQPPENVQYIRNLDGTGYLEAPVTPPLPPRRRLSAEDQQFNTLHGYYEIDRELVESLHQVESEIEDLEIKRAGLKNRQKRNRDLIRLASRRLSAPFPDPHLDNLDELEDVLIEHKTEDTTLN